MQLWRIGNMKVCDATEIRIHGSECNAISRATHEVRFLICGDAHFVFLHLSVIVDVENNEWGAIEFLFGADDGLQYLLKTIERFSMPANDSARLWCLYRDADIILFMRSCNVCGGKREMLQKRTEGGYDQIVIHGEGSVA